MCFHFVPSGVMSCVARVRRRDENIHSQIMYLIRKMWRDKEFLSFISGKK